MSDYSEFKDAPADNILAKIATVALEQKTLEAEVASLEEQLKAKQDELRNVSEFKLPALMDEAEMTSFTLKDGSKIEIKEKIRASIPAANPEPAFNWLKENGHDSLIKTEYTVNFDRDQIEEAQEFEKTLKEEFEDVLFKHKKSVHASTLASFITEQLGEGVDIPLDIFGAFRQRFAKIST